MDTLKRLLLLIGIMLMIWFSAAVVSAATTNTGIQDGAVALAFLTTLIFGLVAGLDAIGDKSATDSATDQAKAKRGSAAAGQDARVALLLSLLSETERDTIRQRLIDDLSADGEALSLAELLAAQEDSHQQRTW